MKHLVLSLSVLATVVFFGACKKSSSAPSNSAKVMFVNGCTPQTTLSLDASVNGSSVAGATALSYGKSSNYEYVTAGNGAVIDFKLSGLNTLFTTTTQSLTVNNNYSVFAGGIFTNPSIVFTNDDLSTPTSGNAKIRVINLCIDTLSITAYAGTTPFATSIASLSASAFVEVPAGSYTIKAGDPSNISTVITASTGSTQLSSGKIYTLIYTGTTFGSGSAALSASIINNN